MVNTKVNNGQYGKCKSVSEGVSLLIDKNGFLQSKSTREPKYSMTSLPQPTLMRTQKVFLIKDLAPPCPSMLKIKVNPSGVAKLLRDLKQHKASGGQYSDIHT